MYTYRIKKYIGAYTAALGRVDALVFTAGVGENSPYVRWHACQGLENLGYSIDEDANNSESRQRVKEIQKNGGGTKILVIPTNEELEIAQQTEAVIRAIE